MKEQIKQIIKENAWEMEKDRFVIGSNNIDEIAECVIKLFCLRIKNRFNVFYTLL